VGAPFEEDDQADGEEEHADEDAEHELDHEGARSHPIDEPPRDEEVAMHLVTVSQRCAQLLALIAEVGHHISTERLAVLKIA